MGDARAWPKGRLCALVAAALCNSLIPPLMQPQACAWGCNCASLGRVKDQGERNELKAEGGWVWGYDTTGIHAIIYREDFKGINTALLPTSTWAVMTYHFKGLHFH